MDPPQEWAVLWGFRLVSNPDECKGGRSYKVGCAAAVMRPFAELLRTLVLTRTLHSSYFHVSSDFLSNCRYFYRHT